MKNLNDYGACFVLLNLAMIFVASRVALASENRVEAERMRLTNYQVDSNDTATFVKIDGSTGVATFNFDLPSGVYDIDARYLSEKVGQNTYAMYLNGVQIISWLGKDQDDQWHLISEQKWHVPRNIAINTGDAIMVETLSKNGSLAVLDYIEFSDSKRADSMIRQNLVTIYPVEYDRAIRNPLKGFRSSLGKEHEYGTLVKTYIKWNDLENSKADGVDKIKGHL